VLGLYITYCTDYTDMDVFITLRAV